jgi:hypothetical protein
MAAVSAPPNSRGDTLVLTLRLLDVHSQPVSDARPCHKPNTKVIINDSRDTV